MSEGWEVEDPFDAEDWDEFEPSGFLRRRPKLVRAVGMVTAASLLLGTLGTAITFLVERNATHLFATSVNSVEPVQTPATSAGSSSGIERVQFTISGDGGADPVCAVTVFYNQRVVGGLVARPAAANRGFRYLDISLSTSPFSGTPADASVVCASDVATLEGSGTG